MGKHVQCLQSTVAVLSRVWGSVVTKFQEKLRRTQVGFLGTQLYLQQMSRKNDTKLRYKKKHRADASCKFAIRTFGLAPPLPVRKRGTRLVLLTHSALASGNRGNTSCTVPRDTWSTQWTDVTCKSAVHTFGLAPPLPTSAPCRRSGRHRQLRTGVVCPLSELE